MNGAPFAPDVREALDAADVDQVVVVLNEPRRVGRRRFGTELDRFLAMFADLREHLGTMRDAAGNAAVLRPLEHGKRWVLELTPGEPPSLRVGVSRDHFHRSGGAAGNRA